MSARRQDRRRSERRVQAIKTRASLLPKRIGGFLANLSADWIAGGIIGGVVLVIGIVFASSWYFGQQRTVGQVFPQIFSLAVSSDSPNRMFIGDATGLFISNDRGKRWSPHVITEPVRRVFSDPNDDKTLYAVGSSAVRRSKDGGLSWTEWESNLPSGMVSAMALDPSDSTKQYAFVASHGLYKSEDGGESWMQQASISDAIITSLAVKAGAPDTLYGFHNTEGLVVSTDSGRHFDPVESSVLPKRAVSDILTFAGDPDTIFVAAARRVYRSTTSGSEWVKLEAGLREVQAIALTRDSNTSMLYVTDPRGIIYVSSDSGESWQRSES